MKLGVFVNDPMLVQLACSFGVLVGWHLEIGGSTPGISQARMAARNYAVTKQHGGQEKEILGPF
jgi:hypothetical protein